MSNSILSGSRTIAGFVLLNIATTLIIWCYVYEMKCVGTLYPFLLDVDASLSTGNVLVDGLLNGLFFVGLIAIMSFVMMLCIRNKMRTVVTFFVKSSLVLLANIVPAQTIKDIFLKMLGEGSPHIFWLTLLASSLYSGLVVIAYFTSRPPRVLLQTISALNCSWTSIFYLRYMPRHTIWFLLLVVIFWDFFSVRGAYGPLKVALQNSQDYSENLLRFLVFIADGQGDSNTNASDSDTNSAVSNISVIDEDLHSYSTDEAISVSTSSAESISNSSRSVSNRDSARTATSISDGSDSGVSIQSRRPEGGRTVFDALNESGYTVIGMGDFVIYGLLVGKAATESGGCFTLAVFFTTIAVLMGLFATLSFARNSETDIESGIEPALPLSLILGVAICFSTTYSNEKLMQITSSVGPFIL